jgi:hypothetical protein
MQHGIRLWRHLFAGAWFVSVALFVAGAAAAQPRTAPSFARLYREALACTEKEFGPEDPKTAERLTDPALFLKEVRRSRIA